MPVGAGLNVIDLRGVDPADGIDVAGAGLLLVGSAAAFGAWAGHGVPIGVVPAVVAAAAAASERFEALHLLVGPGEEAAAERAADWAAVRGMACGVAEGVLDVVARIGPAPMMGPGGGGDRSADRGGADRCVGGAAGAVGGGGADVVRGGYAAARDAGGRGGRVAVRDGRGRAGAGGRVGSGGVRPGVGGGAGVCGGAVRGGGGAGGVRAGGRGGVKPGSGARGAMGDAGAGWTRAGGVGRRAEPAACAGASAVRRTGAAGGDRGIQRAVPGGFRVQHGAGNAGVAVLGDLGAAERRSVGAVIPAGPGAGVRL